LGEKYIAECGNKGNPGSCMAIKMSKKDAICFNGFKANLTPFFPTFENFKFQFD